VLEGYTGGLMQYAYAEKFKNLSEAEIDRVLQSFAFEHCVQHADLVTILQRYLPGGKASSMAG
jgi:endoglucanase